ncbi:MAG: pyridoxal phosphate-dependent aminotransferase [Myxococcota bacterium]
MPRLSERAKKLPSSPIRKLVPFADEARARGVHVHQLNIGQPDVETPRAMIEAYRRFNAKVLAYGPSPGLSELREAIARYYERCGVKLKGSEVCVTNGGSEALLFAFAAICDPGDEILVFEPFYANYNGFAAMLGCTVRPIPSSSHNGFHLPPDATIEAAINAKTRLIVVGSPGNPTGVVYTKEEMLRLGAIAKKHDLFLVSDEVYREFVYDGVVATSALAIPGCEDRVVVVDSVSKRFSACGARIGCTVSKNEELNAAFLRQAQARLCPATVDQYAAIAAYELPPSYFDAVVVEYKARRDALVKGLRSIPGVSTYVPEGAFYTIVDLPVEDTDAFCAWLLKDFSYQGQTVMMAPASGFYATPGAGKQEARIAYVLNVEALEQALAVLRAGLEQYPHKLRR